MDNWNEKVNFIWSVADLLRGPYRPNQYKDIMLPMVVLRRLDCVLEPSKEDVLKKLDSLADSSLKTFEKVLNKVAKQEFHNTSLYTFEKLKGDPDNIAANLINFIKGFSKRALDIIEHFDFEKHIEKLDRANRLFLLIKKFCDIDLHPDKVSNIEMGLIFEELIRRFNEASNEEAGDHFTPRDVIKLMVDLIFCPDSDTLTTKGIIKTVFDPACGTGGMLSVSEEYTRKLNPDATLKLFGQDYNGQSYAVCGSDMMIKGQSMENIKFGDSFDEDQFQGKTFDYMMANPPFGVEWKPEEDFVRREREELGFAGRFGAGLPRINDGALLFLQHMISKMKQVSDGGSRIAIVFNGSPLFTGSSGSGESNIRQWIIENDWLEAIVAMPEQMFYNTGIATYIWIVTNRKEAHRKGKVQLINAVSFFKKMRRSLGNKRQEICDEQREEITRLYGNFEENEFVKIFDNEDFGYQRITVERPLRLNFAINEELLNRVSEIKQFQGLATSKKRKDKVAAEREIAEGQRQQEKIFSVLRGIASEKVYRNREEFIEILKTAFKELDFKISPSLFKGILMALSKRDESADICLDSKGRKEPDPESRDYENVPLKEEIEEYMAREVLSYVPDAWVDDKKTKIGYEISFNRYFYTYTPQRSLEEIESDLKQIESEITELIERML